MRSAASKVGQASSLSVHGKPPAQTGWKPVLLFSLFLTALMLCTSCDRTPSAEETVRLTNAIWDQLYSEKGPNFEEIESLFLAGADPNLKTTENEDYLLERAAEKGWDELSLVFLKYGADPNLHEEEVSPLHWACASSGKDRMAVVRGLVENGADINALDDVHSIPLHWAASGRFDCVAYLLENGADPTTRKKGGETAVDVAKKHSDIYGVDPKYGVSIHEYMLDHIQ